MLVGWESQSKEIWCFVMSLCAALLEQQLEGVSHGVWVQERGDLLEERRRKSKKENILMENMQSKITPCPTSFFHLLIESGRLVIPGCTRAHPWALPAQSAMARTVRGEQKGTTINREMQRAALEMSRTLAAQNASWAPHHIP